MSTKVCTNYWLCSRLRYIGIHSTVIEQSKVKQNKKIKSFTENEDTLQEERILIKPILCTCCP